MNRFQIVFLITAVASMPVSMLIGAAAGYILIQVYMKKED